MLALAIKPQAKQEVRSILRYTSPVATFKEAGTYFPNKLVKSSYKPIKKLLPMDRIVARQQFIISLWVLLLGSKIVRHCLVGFYNA